MSELVSSSEELEVKSEGVVVVSCCSVLDRLFFSCQGELDCLARETRRVDTHGDWSKVPGFR